jgi:hypothetical protein
MNKFLRHVPWFLGFALTCITAMAYVENPCNVPTEAGRWLHGFVKGYRPLLMVLAGAGILGGQVVGELYERAVRTRAVKAVLDAAHEAYFAGVEPDKKYRHRVTLFRCT